MDFVTENLSISAICEKADFGAASPLERGVRAFSRGGVPFEGVILPADFPPVPAAGNEDGSSGQHNAVVADCGR